VNLIIADAIRKRASDIHLEPYEKVRVRYRIDGVLHDMMNPPGQMEGHPSCVKIVESDTVTALPQDGFRKFQNREIKPSSPAHDLRREDRHAGPRQGQRVSISLASGSVRTTSRGSRGVTTSTVRSW
jgi:hypothetical protein